MSYLSASSKLSAFCARPENALKAEDSLFYYLPKDFVTEARALGAQIQRTASGFYDVTPLYDKAEALDSIPDLFYTPLIQGLIEEIKTHSTKDAVAVKLNAPFSILAQVSSQRLYAWLLRNPNSVHAALERLSAQVARITLSAFEAGAAMVSLAEPLASEDMMGAVRFRDFATEYQYRLLKAVAKSTAFGVTHLCPYGFARLEEGGLAAYTKKTFALERYERLLLGLSTQGRMHIIGDQCPHTAYSDELFELTLK
jgi:hypothetical protein